MCLHRHQPTPWPAWLNMRACGINAQSFGQLFDSTVRFAVPSAVKVCKRWYIPIPAKKVLPSKKQKHTTVEIRAWSPTALLPYRFMAWVQQSERDALFSITYGRMCLFHAILRYIKIERDRFLPPIEHFLCKSLLYCVQDIIELWFLYITVLIARA